MKQATETTSSDNSAQQIKTTSSKQQPQIHETGNRDNSTQQAKTTYSRQQAQKQAYTTGRETTSADISRHR